MVFHVRRLLECNEGNLGLSEGSVELCSKGGLLGVHPKYDNVLHRLGVRRLMSI